MTARPAIVLLLLAAACKRGAPPTADPPAGPGEAWLTPEQMQSNQIATAEVTEQEVGGVLVTSGRLAFDDLHVAHVFSPVTGRVVQIQAQLGQQVAKGTPLVSLQSPDVGSAFADLNKAQADLTAAEHELRRQRELFAAHAGSKRDLEIAEDNAAKAKAELERTRAKARLFYAGEIDAVTQRYILKSPIAGEVIARNVNPGTEVQGQYSGASTPLELFTIGDIDQLWVLADVFEVDLPQVKPGAPVTITVVSYPDRRYEGVVDWISGSFDPNTRTARVRCAVRNQNHELRPEMYATVSIGVEKRSTLAIPRSALLRLSDQTVVFVETGKNDEGKVKFARRVVKVDDSVRGDFLPVRAGLQPGEKVVVSGGLLLSGMI